MSEGTSKENNNTSDAKAQAKNDDTSWSSWGSSWLNAAKEKTWETYEMVKKDLDEFQEVVGTEAAKVASSTATVVSDQVTNLEKFVADDPKSVSTDKAVSQKEETTASNEHEGAGETGEKEGSLYDLKSLVNPAPVGTFLKSLASTVNKALVIDNTHDEETEIPITADSQSRKMARLYVIQSDVGTYANEPEGSPELFDDWLEFFRLEERADDISNLLGKTPHIRTVYTQLVPGSISNQTFWERYFYKVHQFELDEARRSALIRRSTIMEHETLDKKSSWGDEDEDKLEAEIAALQREGSQELLEVPVNQNVENDSPVIDGTEKTIPSKSIPDKNENVDDRAGGSDQEQEVLPTDLISAPSSDGQKERSSADSSAVKEEPAKEEPEGEKGTCSLNLDKAHEDNEPAAQPTTADNDDDDKSKNANENNNLNGNGKGSGNVNNNSNSSHGSDNNNGGGDTASDSWSVCSNGDPAIPASSLQEIDTSDDGGAPDGKDTPKQDSPPKEGDNEEDWVDWDD